MTRGTFANVRVSNRLATEESGKVREGGWTRDFTRGQTIADAPITYIFDASENYRAAGVPLVVIAGKDYGMGSSRDWAAKGAFLLGVKAVIAESFERIHRSNLVFMGVLPLVFQEGQNASILGIRGDERFDVEVPAQFEPRQLVMVRATRPDGSSFSFECMLRLDTPVEIEYSRNGGILHTVIRKKLNEARQMA
jgi:aconitate hydratase